MIGGLGLTLDECVCKLQTSCGSGSLLVWLSFIKTSSTSLRWCFTISPLIPMTQRVCYAINRVLHNSVSVVIVSPGHPQSQAKEEDH